MIWLQLVLGLIATGATIAAAWYARDGERRPSVRRLDGRG
jgi:hypothetical protein